MTNKRNSRFADSAHEVVGVSELEEIIPDERSARELAKAFAPDRHSGRYSDDHDAFLEAVRLNNERSGVRNKTEVSTDAVTAVTETSDDGWLARWVIAEQDGKPVARSLLLEPATRATPASGVTTNLLRELSPARAAAIASERTQNPSDADPWPVDLGIKWAKRDIAEFGPAADTSTPGRPRLADSLLRDVAVAYLEELRNGRGVLQRLSSRFDRPSPTIRDWVRAARERGWLGPAPKQGKSGGIPGPLLLAEQEKADDTKGTNHE